MPIKAVNSHSEAMIMKVLLVLTLAAILCAPSLGITNNEKNAVNSVMKAILDLDQSHISHSDVTVDDSGDIYVDITPENGMDDWMNCIGDTLGAYAGIIDSATSPDLGELHINLYDKKGKLTGSTYCLPGWSKAVRTNPDGTWNNNDVIALATKVLYVGKVYS